MSSQTIEFIKKNDTLQRPKLQEFIYLFEDTVVSKSIFVAKIKATGSQKTPSHLFEKIKKAAQKIGSNTFKFESFKKTNADDAELILSVYFCDDSILDENFKSIPKNKIYIFGSQNLLENKVQTYKVQGEKFEIESGKFKSFEIKLGEEIKINKGGFTGMTLWISGEENKLSSFLSFSGIGVGGAAYNPYNGGVGLNFNTGTINRVEINLALLLLKIFEEQK